MCCRAVREFSQHVFACDGGYVNIVFKTFLAALLLAVSSFADRMVKTTHNSNPPGWPLIMSTYLGGSGEDGSHEFPYYMDAIEDANGNLYIAAITTSTDLPTVPGSYQCSTCGGLDIMVAKLSPDLTSILAMARIGGSGEDTDPRIALGVDGRVYLLARTASANYPTTVNAYRRSRRGSSDFVITAFDSGLSTVVASTYFGGYGIEYAPSLATNDLGDVYISGHVDANGVTTTAGAAQPDFGGGANDCFVSGFSPNLDALKASTLLGGKYSEEAGGIALFSNGDIVVGLGTHSDNFPTTEGAYDTSFHGTPGECVECTDCAITRLNADLTAILASTYVGGSAHDRVTCIQTDDYGNVWFSGLAFSLDYPTTEGSFDPVHAPEGTHEEFVSKMSGDLTQLFASTYLSPNFTVGGTPQINNILVDSTGLVYVAGLAWDSIYVTPDAYDPSWNNSVDHFLMVLTDDLSHVTYSTLLGGADFESDSRIVSARAGNATIAGVASSHDYPSTTNAINPSYLGGASDLTVTRIGIGSCCRGTRGNVNFTGIVDLGDLSALVSYLTGGGCVLPCPNEANVNAVGIVDLADLSALVSYLTGGGYVLPTCP